MLPKHGKIDCRLCFGDADKRMREPNPNWKMANDPGAWGGGTDPEYLVLGFSKGATQADIYASGRFEDVAFAGMRPRLSEALQALGVLKRNESIDAKISNPNSNIAFGSLIRCSVSRINKSASSKAGHDVYACSGQLITKSFTEIPDVIGNCTKRFLTDWPASVRAVFLLGITKLYVEKCQCELRKLFPDNFKVINEVAVFANNRIWVNIAHPSKANGHFYKWLYCDNGSGARRLAMDAMKKLR
jgi:hypothetical protein